MFEYTDLERKKVIEGYFISQNPLRLRLFPKKQKKQYIILNIIADSVLSNQKYSEETLNTVLRLVYPDFASIRRGLIDYKLMARTPDGKEYCLK